ncbi:hypothetical protein ACE1CI_33970 [Aerosakkonemataceae cyanobacterium BLCC-F50]|uniref:Uncharacterized protein n=1 Tax=Floridaenema flaviceps BLCC-F50 TaxID=3153642 RepID=A0ABV4Y4B3_9CYAN
MWLKYAVDANNTLVEIADVSRGKTKLYCPYCGGLAELSRQVQLAGVIKSLNLAEQLVDLRLYRAQLANILLHRLYYLQIEADGLMLHKSGVTKRSLSQRIPEIERGLRSHYQDIKITVLGLWLHRGNVELYFKHRYKPFTYPTGSLTEYYFFSDTSVADSVLDDLNQMQPKVLNPEEESVLAEANFSQFKEMGTLLLSVKQLSVLSLKFSLTQSSEMSNLHNKTIHIKLKVFTFLSGEISAARHLASSISIASGGGEKLRMVMLLPKKLC